METHFTSLDYAISAIGHREALLRWSVEVADEALGLTMANCNNSLTEYSAWSAWENRHSHWEGIIQNWLIFASPYWKGLREAVMQTPEYLYANAHWSVSDDQFPDSSAVRKYKTFCIVQGNWETIKDKVHAVVRQVAFEGKIPVSAQV